MSDRLSRKEIRHDKFVEDVESVYSLAARNRKQVVIALVAVLAIAAAVWGWVVYQRSNERKAQAALAEAISVLDAQDPAPATPGVPPPAANDAQKLAKAQPMFAAVSSKYSGTEAADVAELYLARVAASRGDFAAAKTKLQGFVSKHPDHLLAGGAQLSLYEMQLQGPAGPKEVIAAVEKELAKSDTVLPKDALLALLARAYEASGSQDKARDVYQRIVNEFPDSPYTIDAQRKLAV